MNLNEHQIKKASRLRKQLKRQIAKTSATLAGQKARIATVKGYKTLNKVKVKLNLINKK